MALQEAIMTVPASESPTASRNAMSVTSCEARFASHQAPITAGFSHQARYPAQDVADARLRG